MENLIDAERARIGRERARTNLLVHMALADMYATLACRALGVLGVSVTLLASLGIIAKFFP